MSGLRSLDVDCLRTFLACCEAPSFAEAGAWVNKSQSTVSMQMRALAETVGRPLFVREGRRNIITPAGRELKDFAQRLVRLNDEAIGRFRLFHREGRRNVLTPAGRDLKDYAQRLVRLNDEAIGRFRPEGLEGRLSIGTPDDYAATFLPQVFGDFAHQHPKVEIAVVSDGSDQLAAGVASGRLDLAVVSMSPNTRGAQVLFQEDLVWVAPQDRRLEETRPLPVALWHHGCVWRDVALEALDGAGIDCRPAYTGSSTAALAMAVEAGLAISALPARFRTGSVRVVQDGVLPRLRGFEIGLLRSDTRPRVLADEVADAVVRAFARLAPGEDDEPGRFAAIA